MPNEDTLALATAVAFLLDDARERLDQEGQAAVMNGPSADVPRLREKLRLLEKLRGRIEALLPGDRDERAG